MATLFVDEVGVASVAAAARDPGTRLVHSDNAAFHLFAPGSANTP